MGSAFSEFITRLALLVHEPLMGGAIALLALAAPIGCAAWLRRQALRAPSRDVAPAWFGYARRAQWLVIGTWLLWLIALSISGADQGLPRALRPERDGWTAMVRWMLTVIPPALASLGIQAITHDVQRRLRGSETTLSEHLRSSLIQLAALIVPFSLLLLTPIAFLTQHAALGALSAIGAVLSRMWLLRLHADALGLEPLSVTTGPLRDCLFDLARRAGVPIRQLYVLPTTRGRLANAFAMSGGSVILTDYLLEHLSEREVAATLAHEIGHLRGGHPRKLALTLVASAVAWASVLPPVAENIGLSRVFAIVLSVLLSGFVTMLVARGFERAADAYAVELTRDPESLITALVRLSRVNHVPLDWGAWAERGLTHPSTVRRAHVIGRRAGLTAARVEELLHHTPPVARRFALEVPKLGDRFFTALWKARVNANGVVVLLALYGWFPPRWSRCCAPTCRCREPVSPPSCSPPWPAPRCRSARPMLWRSGPTPRCVAGSPNSAEDAGLMRIAAADGSSDCRPAPSRASTIFTVTGTWGTSSRCASACATSAKRRASSFRAPRSYRSSRCPACRTGFRRRACW